MRVLLTGATGYIGGKLRGELQKDEGVHLRLLIRDKNKVESEVDSNIEVVEGSTFDEKSLQAALREVDIAYYLIHSMAARGDFEKLDRLSAENFLRAAIDQKVKRIIYLGGLGHRETASKHLLSRIETGEILSSRPAAIQTLWFRAGIIIGAGSASFEIIRHLVNRIPLMTTPRWVRTRTEPISIHDVVRYLLAARRVQVEGNLVVDIGSGEMTFQEMLLRAARVMGKRRLIIPVPLLSPRLSSLWLILFSPVHFRIARALIDGLKSETVVTNDNARKYFHDIQPLAFEKSMQLALADND